MWGKRTTFCRLTLDKCYFIRVLAYRLAPKRNFVLFKVPSVFFVPEHEVEVIVDGKAMLDRAIRGREGIRREVEANRHAVAFDGGPVHDFEGRDGVTLEVAVGPGPDPLAPQNGQRHGFYLDSDQKKENLASDHIGQMIARNHRHTHTQLRSDASQREYASFLATYSDLSTLNSS